MKTLRIRIVGGSVAGLFAATLLQLDGHDVEVYERSSQGLAGRGAGLVAQHEVFQILRMIGCEHVAHVGVVANERIFFDRAGNVEQRSAFPQTQISWDHLYSSLAARLDSSRYFLGRRVVEADTANGQLEFEDGATEQADLIIGADGLGSAMRAIVNPDDFANKYVGYVAWRGLLAESDLPAEASILLDRFAFYSMPHSHILGYLVSGSDAGVAVGQRRYNWVWFRGVGASELAATLTDKDGKTYPFSLPRHGLSDSRLGQLRSDARDMLPPQFAAAVGAEDAPSIQAIFDYIAPAMVRGRLVLIGDAAFVARPHTAMGVSKAAGDVMALRQALGSSDDLSQALAEFEVNRIDVGREIVQYGQRLGASLS